MSVDHDRMTVDLEFITARHDALPGSLPIIIDEHDSMTVVHARMSRGHGFDIADHEFVIIGSVRENFGSS